MLSRLIVLPGLAAILAMGMAMPATAIELVSNGGFETGDFTDWTRFGGAGQTNVNTGDAVGGDYGARFSPNTPGGITQDIVTTAGTAYLFAFDLTKFANPNRVPTNLFSVAFDGIVLSSLTDSAGFALTSYSFAPVATGPLTTITFTFRDNWNGPNNRWSIDNISVSAISRVGGVPEPASWVMLLAGFGLVGYAARRNRNALPAVAA